MYLLTFDIKFKVFNVIFGDLFDKSLLQCPGTLPALSYTSFFTSAHSCYQVSNTQKIFIFPSFLTRKDYMDFCF